MLNSKYPKLGKIQLGKVQEEVLRALGGAGALTMAILASGGSSRRIFDYLNRYKRGGEQLQRSLQDLERKKLISAREVDGAEEFVITKAGKRHILKYRFDDMRLSRSKKWDGRWHVVMFDIPERHGRARRALLYKIKEMGALPLQKSVFIYPFPWQDEIDFVTEFLQVSPFVRYLEASSIEGEKELKHRFHL